MKSQKIKRRKSKHTTVENYQFKGKQQEEEKTQKTKKQGKYEIPENSYSEGISKSFPTSNYSKYKCIEFSKEKI